MKCAFFRFVPVQMGEDQEMKYVHIVDEIIRQIEEGLLKPGHKLPSIRALSKEFACSKNTVIRAYQELESKHLIYSVPKSGYYVVDNHRFRLSHSTENKKIDFLSAGPDRHVMPFRDFQHCINQAIETYKHEMFVYSEPQGLYSLREQLVQYLRNNQVFTTPERICVVSGSQQALNLFVSLPFPNGKIKYAWNSQPMPVLSNPFKYIIQHPSELRSQAREST